MPPVDLSGKTCLVTGAAAGIGKEVARSLARAGATVVLACRDAARGEAARAELAAACGGRGNLELLEIDLSLASSIAAAARAFLGSHARLDVLVNNAGVWERERSLTAEGVEATWATNQLGYHRLTAALLGLLKVSAPARVVNVASEYARGLDLDDPEFSRRPFDGAAAYAQSKQANRMWTWALARRLEGTGVSANAMHPGGVRTRLWRRHDGTALGWGVAAYLRLFGRTPEQGADTASWLASSPEAAGRTGLFWKDRRERACPFRGLAAEERLWALCERYGT